VLGQQPSLAPVDNASAAGPGEFIDQKGWRPGAHVELVRQVAGEYHWTEFAIGVVDFQFVVGEQNVKHRSRKFGREDGEGQDSIRYVVRNPSDLGAAIELSAADYQGWRVGRDTEFPCFMNVEANRLHFYVVAFDGSTLLGGEGLE